MMFDSNKTGNSRISVKIDGKEIMVEKGTTILEAASKIGIHIPTLCFYKFLEPAGKCGVCTVEIKVGDKKKMAMACKYEINENMEIFTDSEKVRKNRKTILEMLIAKCPDIEPIKKLAAKYGVTDTRFPKQFKDCILCGLCADVCNNLVKAHAITMKSKSDKEGPPFEVDTSKCILCGACAYVCPTGCIKVEDERGRSLVFSEMTLGTNTAIHLDFMQAVPASPRIDTDNCIHVKTGGCGICEQVCEADAINYDDKEEIVEEEVGNIILATGYKTFDPSRLKNYGYGVYDNVLTGLEFEKLTHASGPTGGKVVCADGREPETVAILHCIGSRDKNTNEYCSRICCMYSLKFAHLVKEKTNAKVIQFYIDMRTFGKGYEEFYNRLLKEDVIFVRGKGVEVSNYAEYPEEKGKLIVKCEDTLLSMPRRIPVDMVILSTGVEPDHDVEKVAHTFRVSRSKDGFFLERHPKLAPVSTATEGVYIAGACQGPKDIPDTVAQGCAAASNVLQVIDCGEVTLEPTTAHIDAEVCTGCQTCLKLCPYEAISRDEEKKVAVINEALCKGCGTCVAACPSGAARQRGFEDIQILAELEGLLEAAVGR